MLVDLPQFDKATVLVIGDMMLDRYWHGNTQRISPEAPVPVVQIKQIEERLGGAGNVALNIRALGTTTHLIGVTGDDHEANVLQDKLAAASVNAMQHRLKTMQTITKLRVISHHQQLIRLDFEDKSINIDSQKLIASCQDYIGQSGALVLSDYGKGTLQDPQPFIALAKKRGVPVLVDPKGKDFARYRGASILTPNRKEFEAVVGECHSDKDIVEKGQQAIIDNDLQALLITRGEQGMTLLQRNKPAFHLPAKAKEVYDVTGAGDTVIAVLAASIAAGESFEQAIIYANIAAGIVVGRLGAATITVPELRRAMQRMQGMDRGVFSEEQLLNIVHDARAHGERIVLTNGCFDLLHAGHVSYLQQAKMLGDKLIVAVNSDDSVRRLKGPGRPINPLARRMAVLAGLGAVDWVVDFSEDTPERLISEILPDVLVKGGDYKVEDIAGAKQVLANHGQVKILEFIDGCSTTKMVENILEVME